MCRIQRSSPSQLMPAIRVTLMMLLKLYPAQQVTNDKKHQQLSDGLKWVGHIGATTRSISSIWLAFAPPFGCPYYQAPAQGGGIPASLTAGSRIADMALRQPACIMVLAGKSASLVTPADRQSACVHGDHAHSNLQ
jgi:hypothetical protein